MAGHDVVVSGFRLNGAESPAKVLERVLRCSGEQARALSKRFPVTVQGELSRAAADSLAAQLREAGARVEVREVASPALAQTPVDGAQPESAGRAPIAPPEPVGPLAAPPVESPAASPDTSFKVGTLRIQVPAKARDSLAGKYLIGTLKILLPAGGPPPPPAAAPAPAMLPPSAPGGELANPYGAGVRDSVLDDPSSAAALELDTDALQQGGRYVSGGRAQQRPSLMMRVRRSLADMPSNLVLRRRPSKRTGMPSRGLWRSRPMLLALLGGLLVLVGHGVLGSVSEADGAPLDAQRGTALGEQAATKPAAKSADEGTTGAQAEEAADEPQPALNPLLQLAPKPMEAALAAIMRKRIPGVHAVGIDWPEGQEPKEPLSCMLVEGNTAQRAARVHTLLTTGRRAALTPMIESQLRDHAEVLRVALGSANAQFASLCLRN